MARQISGGRKFLYYLGSLMMFIGLLSFLYTFVGFFMAFGDSNGVEAGFGAFKYAVFGMVLLVLGGIIRGVGAMGLAGSGVVLDPERAREEIEPFSRMAGGVVKDVLDEADINLSGRSGAERSGGSDEPVVMVRCQSCRKLNEEDSKFCQECGDQI
ncbi:MAG: zinc ribbon domain-containing protein [Planctomycetes bacterium]|nr:zinc ribbon domain-containing protein [Planctomycetota bacterium]MCP4771921.1 zinc ribbon domain-containing protein [Planctomycetota bacterium]MCP4859966.1 zinc ribbon domain-containing protein [Planctomycetota bacterium]